MMSGSEASDQGCNKKSFFSHTIAALIFVGTCFMSGVGALMLYLDNKFDTIGFKFLNTTAFKFMDKIGQEEHIPQPVMSYLNKELAGPKGQSAMHEAIGDGYKPIHHDVLDSGYVGAGIGVGCLALFAIYFQFRKCCSPTVSDSSESLQHDYHVPGDGSRLPDGLV